MVRTLKKSQIKTIPKLPNERSKKRKKKIEINEALIENFVSLQRVLTNLSLRFDTLSEQISKLLQLFEISAKSFTEKYGDKGIQKDKEFLDKLNSLGDQNKIIARGLTLMEQKLRDRIYGEPQKNRQFPQREISRDIYNPEGIERDEKGRIRPKSLPRI